MLYKTLLKTSLQAALLLQIWVKTISHFDKKKFTVVLLTYHFSKGRFDCLSVTGSIAWFIHPCH